MPLNRYELQSKRWGSFSFLGFLAVYMFLEKLFTPCLEYLHWYLRCVSRNILVHLVLLSISSWFRPLWMIVHELPQLRELQNYEGYAWIYSNELKKTIGARDLLEFAMTTTAATTTTKVVTFVVVVIPKDSSCTSLLNGIAMYCFYGSFTSIDRIALLLVVLDGFFIGEWNLIAGML